MESTMKNKAVAEPTAADFAARIGELETRRAQLVQKDSEINADADSIRIALGESVARGDGAATARLKTKARDLIIDGDANSAGIQHLDQEISRLESQRAAAEARETAIAHGAALSELEDAAAAYNAKLAEALAELEPFEARLMSASRKEGFFHEGGADEHRRPQTARIAFHVASILKHFKNGGVLPR